MSDLTSEEQKEYNEFIKSSVSDGSYFKDARDWYIFRYVQPIWERTILFFANIVAGFVTYILIITIINALPMKEEKAIIIKSKDQSRYFPVMVPLRDSVDIRSIDEAVLKYLITNYVKKREGFDLRKTNIDDLTLRMNYIKNNSSIQEYKNFQNFVDTKNPESPILYFGRDFQRVVEIESVEFPEQKRDNIAEQAKYFVTSDVPQSANVRYTITNKVNSVGTAPQRYLVRINFKFSGVNSKNTNSKLNFLITSYKIYKIKWRNLH